MQEKCLSFAEETLMAWVSLSGSFIISSITLALWFPSELGDLRVIKSNVYQFPPINYCQTKMN